MSQAIRYFVAGQRGRWMVWREGDSTPVTQTKNKHAAIVTARTLARRDAGAIAVFSAAGRMGFEHRCRRTQSPSYVGGRVTPSALPHRRTYLAWEQKVVLTPITAAAAGTPG
jgi:hypothetical protein